MKKLKQFVLDNAPFWVKSTAVDSNGNICCFDVSKKQLVSDDDGWWGDSVGMSFQFKADWDITNWQNSATNIR